VGRMASTEEGQGGDIDYPGTVARCSSRGFVFEITLTVRTTCNGSKIKAALRVEIPDLLR
jgi:hypothetical protein